MTAPHRFGPISDLVSALRARLVRSPVRDGGGRARQRGQVLPIFAIMAVVILGASALLTDVAWWWVNQQRMQRAADAGALAGAIFLPGDQATAYGRALQEAAKNGFVHGQGGITVTPSRDPSDPRKLVVDVDGPVSTHFAKVFCFDDSACLSQVQASARGAASFVLPVPMGSPQNYYGLGFLKDSVTTTNSGWTDFNGPDEYLSGAWNRPWRAGSVNSEYTTADGTTDRQRWYDFDLTGQIPNTSGLTVTGMEVRLDGVTATGSGEATDCRIDVDVNWRGGDSSAWSNVLQTDPLPTDSAANPVVGEGLPISDWYDRTWRESDFDRSRFIVRLTWRDDISGCHEDRDVRVDALQVRVHYEYSQTEIVEKDVTAPDGSGVLVPHGFWGALQSQGAPSIQGDAYMPYYDRRTSRSNINYDPRAYYQYGIEIPGSGSGTAWLFDPGFCRVDSNKGTGESYTTSDDYGTSTFNPVSTFYDLWDTRNTPYNTLDDTLVWSSLSEFRETRWRDSVLYTGSSTTGSLCDDLNWHNDWYQIPATLTGGHDYRLHTYSTDPGSSNPRSPDPGSTEQRNATALNAFSIYASSSSGTPKVYGLGAMEAYVRLPGGSATQFYLAQIDQEHAGKTMVIKLWDPGDTGLLSADLSILKPSFDGWTATPFYWSSTQDSSHYRASSCEGDHGGPVSSLTTNPGGGYSNSYFNGCWLTFEIPLPNDYQAHQDGWWKIRYDMSGNSSDYSTDLTTWQVELRGNPVHLVLH